MLDYRQVADLKEIVAAAAVDSINEKVKNVWLKAG